MLRRVVVGNTVVLVRTYTNEETGETYGKARGVYERGGCNPIYLLSPFDTPTWDTLRAEAMAEEGMGEVIG